VTATSGAEQAEENAAIAALRPNLKNVVEKIGNITTAPNPTK
jgi:hypothetical protein